MRMNRAMKRNSRLHDFELNENKFQDSIRVNNSSTVNIVRSYEQKYVGTRG